MGRSITPAPHGVDVTYTANPSKTRITILKITGKSGRALGNLARMMPLPSKILQSPENSIKDKGSVVGPGMWHKAL